MANTTLVPDVILRKCLQVLHAKLNFIGSINRDYDSNFAKTGAKIGESLRIRLPEKFSVTTGATYVAQDSTEQSTTMTVSTRKHVGMKFTMQDLTMSIDDFSERKIVPAMSVLASEIEADALNMIFDIYNMVGSPGTPPTTLSAFGNARAKLNKYLAPNDGRRMALIDSDTSAGMVESYKSLFQDSAEIARQYREGTLGRVQGFTFAENDLMPTLTTGSRAPTDPVVVTTGAAVNGSSLPISGLTGAATIALGEIFTIDGVYAVHPETKTAFSHLQQFVVTAAATCVGGAVTLSISPAINDGSVVSTAAYQNVSTPVINAMSVNFAAADGGSGAASTVFQQLLTYHKDAFTFVTADLEMPDGVDFKARQVMDNISMRIIRDWNFTNDQMQTRIDVLYGYKTIRPELACRVAR